MNYLEGIHFDENKLTRTNMPKPVFEELTHQESLYPEFHAFNYTKSCLTPEDCVYTITGSDLVEDPEDRHMKSKNAKLTIIYKKDPVSLKYSVSSTFTHFDTVQMDSSSPEKMAA